jgi:SPP1 gp7 family putative phage head morphogenesis protein
MKTFLRSLLGYFAQSRPVFAGKSAGLSQPERTKNETELRRIMSAPTWREAIHTQRGGNAIYAGLIEDLSGALGDNVNRLLNESCARSPMTCSLPTGVIICIHLESLKGRRPDSIAKALHPLLPEITYEKLRSIVQTVTSKATSAMTQARSEDIGIEWYEWSTSEDARVRPSHQLMNKVLVNWKWPPAPEALNGEDSKNTCHAGEAEGCRCVSLPLVNLDVIAWPHLVHWQGRIQMMARPQFAKIFCSR